MAMPIKRLMIDRASRNRPWVPVSGIVVAAPSTPDFTPLTWVPAPRTAPLPVLALPAPTPPALVPPLPLPLPLPFPLPAPWPPPVGDGVGVGEDEVPAGMGCS